MKLQTKMPLHKADNQFGYDSRLLLLGSCFVENIGGKLEYFKFQALQNPFGILFHPIAIENLLKRAIKGESYTEKDILFLNERWHCFDAHSDLSDPSAEKLLHKLNSGLEETGQYLTQASHIIITLGTAWVYRNDKSKSVVANCHKLPQNDFTKELLSVETIIESLNNIMKQVRPINPDAVFIFTVSPVRHLKDGFVQNQRSKSNLITAIHQTLENAPLANHPFYFPAYELMMDELRDYRFYTSDMIHPNELAIDYIWEKFNMVWISEKANTTMQKVEEIQKGLRHKPFDPNSKGHAQFQKSMEQKITYLQQEYPFMDF